MAALVHAQPLGENVVSIDWMVSEAPSIVIGRVASIVHPTGDYNKAQITVRVEKTLKGDPVQTTTFSVDPLYADVVDAYADQTKVMVLFRPLYRGTTAAQNPPLFVVSGSPIAPETTVDLKYINKADDLIAEVQRLVDSDAGPSLGNWTVRVHMEGVGGTLRQKLVKPRLSGVLVPIDRNLLASAKQWLKSKDWRVRYEALDVLHHFESPDLIPLIKPLLQDPGYDVRQANQNKGIEERTFRVRESAFAMLKRLGVNVDPPVFTESVSQIPNIDILYWWSVEKPGELAVLKDAHKLEEFHTYSTRISSEDILALTKVPTLRKIVMSQNAISHEDLKLLVGMKSLTSLMISGFQLNDESVDVFAAMPKLRMLNMISCRITPAGIERLRKLRPDIYLRIAN